MVRFAENADHPRLKALWAEAFGDPRDAIETYFTRRHTNGNMLVDVREGIVTGMLSMLPVTLDTAGGRAFPARYIYAVATDVRYRRQGVGTALLQAAHTHMKGLGEAAAVLAPASPNLFRYYQHRGYLTVFSLDVITLDASALPPFPPGGKVRACPAGAYARLRNQAFRDRSLYVRWDEPAVAYAVQTFTRPGGVAALSWEGGHGCAAWETTTNGILVKELALTGGDEYIALSVLHRQLNAAQYTVRLAQGTISGAAPQPFGMIRWLIEEPALAGAPPYLSLAMD